MLAGTGPPVGCEWDVCWGSPRGYIARDSASVARVSGTARARLPPVSFPLRADRRVRRQRGIPIGRSACAHAPLRTHARHPPRRRGRQEPGGHRPRHPPDHGGVAARSSRSPRGAAGASPTRSTDSARARTTSSCSRHRPALLTELEHSLLITEEVIRHLVTRDERPVKAGRREDGDAEDAEDGEDAELPSDSTGTTTRTTVRADRRGRERGGPGRHRLRSARRWPCAR